MIMVNEQALFWCQQGQQRFTIHAYILHLIGHLFPVAISLQSLPKIKPFNIPASLFK
jgi:hypothetical protein